MAKHNLCFVGLSKSFIDSVVKNIADINGLFFANVDKFIDFEFDCKNIELGGKEYIEKQEQKIIRRVCEFENTIIYIDYAKLNNPKTLKTIRENCVLVFIEMNFESYLKSIEFSDKTQEQKLIDIDLFNDRNTLCKISSDHIVSVDSCIFDDVVNAVNKEFISIVNNGEVEFNGFGNEEC